MKRVTVAEDDPGIQDVLEIILSRAGYEVTVFAEGKHLLRHDLEIPDVYLIDKQLPGVDGLDICKHLKSRAETKNVPVVILSATPHIEKAALKAGADAFIEKPFSRTQLLALVASLLTSREELPV